MISLGRTVVVVVAALVLLSKGGHISVLRTKYCTASPVGCIGFKLLACPCKGFAEEGWMMKEKNVLVLAFKIILGEVQLCRWR